MGECRCDGANVSKSAGACVGDSRHGVTETRRVPNAGSAGSLPIHVPPVPDANHNHDKLTVANGIDYAIGSRTDTVQIFDAGQFFDSAGAGVVFQGFESSDYAPSHVFGKAVKGLCRPRANANGILHAPALL